MARALALADGARGRTAPNPTVGAVLVKDGRFLGEGVHRGAGEAHAEAEALAAAAATGAAAATAAIAAEARGATLYVTLEPCCHHGRTPPCTEAIVDAGVSEVVYAVRDPDPRVNGGGRQRLEEAGVRVRSGLKEAEARRLNAPFFHFVETGRPLVRAKYAMSLDGKIATRTGDSRWISGEASRRATHELRDRLDGIVVGGQTVRQDDPSLTTREGIEAPHHPVRLVVDSSRELPADARVFSGDLPGRTVLATWRSEESEYCAGLRRRGVEIWDVGQGGDGRLDLAGLVARAGDEGLRDLLVEGGGILLASFLAAGLIDRALVIVAPLFVGGEAAPGPMRGEGVERLSDAPRLENAEIRVVGTDVWIEGDVIPAGPGETNATSSPAQATQHLATG